MDSAGKSCTVIAYTMTSMLLWYGAAIIHIVLTSESVSFVIRKAFQLRCLWWGCVLSTAIPLHVCLLHAARSYFQPSNYYCWIYRTLLFLDLFQFVCFFCFCFFFFLLCACWFVVYVLARSHRQKILNDFFDMTHLCCIFRFAAPHKSVAPLSVCVCVCVLFWCVSESIMHGLFFIIVVELRFSLPEQWFCSISACFISFSKLV